MSWIFLERLHDDASLIAMKERKLKMISKFNKLLEKYKNGRFNTSNINWNYKTEATNVESYGMHDFLFQTLTIKNIDKTTKSKKSFEISKEF